MIKLLDIIRNKEVLNKLHSLPLSTISGKTAFKLRKIIKKLQTELDGFEEAKTQYIKENGTADADGNMTIQGKEEMEKANNFLVDMSKEEIDIDWEPLFDEDDLSNISSSIELKISDIDFLEVVGLYKSE